MYDICTTSNYCQHTSSASLIRSVCKMSGYLSTELGFASLLMLVSSKGNSSAAMPDKLSSINLVTPTHSMKRRFQLEFLSGTSVSSRWKLHNFWLPVPDILAPLLLFGIRHQQSMLKMDSPPRQTKASHWQLKRKDLRLSILWIQRDTFIADTLNPPSQGSKRF